MHKGRDSDKPQGKGSCHARMANEKAEAKASCQLVMGASFCILDP